MYFRSNSVTVSDSLGLIVSITLESGVVSDLVFHSVVSGFGSFPSCPGEFMQTDDA